MWENEKRFLVIWGYCFMESLRELYRIGRGPSSSHTMGPSHAAALFREEFPQGYRFQVVLYGSLAKTGKGHLTDVAIQDAFRASAHGYPF